MTRIREFFARYPLVWVAIGLGLASVLVLVVVVVQPWRPSADADPSPSAEATQVASASPTATDSGAACEVSDPGPPTANPLRPFVATVLVDDLRVRSEAGTAGAPVAVLQAGQVVWVTDGPAQVDGSDWYMTQHGSPDAADANGWVSAGPPEQPFLDLRSALPVGEPAAVQGLSAGGPGFLSWGIGPHRTDEVAQAFVARSSDGVAWRRAELPVEMTDQIASIAWGPAGWIAVTTISATGEAGTFWQSTDGVCWDALPAFSFPNVVPRMVVGSSAGYALTVNDNRSGNTKPNLYFATDGLAWDEVGPGPEFASSGVVALEPGFLRWIADGSATHIRLSKDGLTWQEAGGDLPMPWNKDPLFAIAGGWLVAVTTEYADASQTVFQSVWRAQLGGSSLAWESVANADEILPANAIDSLASDGSTILAVGYTADDAELRMWRTADGATWTEVPAAAVFGGIPEFVIGADAGFVGAGGIVTDAGLNPVFWHADDPGSWTAESAPVLGLVDSPVTDGCPGLPLTMVDWLVIPRSLATACLGDAPITFRGWLTVAGGCGGLSPGIWEPPWLAAPFAANPIILSPFETSFSGCETAVPHPTSSEVPAPQQWVLLTGHYNDPAAETCRWSPDPLYPFAVQRWGIDLGCRQRLVATSVVPESR